MKKHISNILIILLCIGGMPVHGADFEKGWATYDSGDYAAALREWRPLAEAGDADAQFNLGDMYRRGQGVTQDYKEAAKWYRRAAEQGQAEAQYNLGVMHYKGHGLLQNYSEAIKWYRQAAERDHTDAQFNLGVMYHRGEGVTHNYICAHLWFNLAAAAGDEQAAKNRDDIAKWMSTADVVKAQGLARQYLENSYRDC